ncbi:unnamed protein product, partial [Symbiodinium necroappetens]
DFEDKNTYGSTATWIRPANPRESMSRTKLLETNSSVRPEDLPSMNTSEAQLEWEAPMEDLYLASLDLGPDLGLKTHSELRGEAVARRLKGEQSGEQMAEEELLGLSSSGSSSLFQLFSFKHPGNINFQLKGLLDGNSLELGMRMGFGPFESEEKRLKLVDIVDQFAVTLNALPFVSSKSKEKALDALRSFSTNYVPPTLFEPGTMVALYSKKHRRYIRASNRRRGRGDLKSTGKMNARDLKKTWSRVYFTVVDAGNGEVAFHNPKFNRFIRMKSKTNMDMSDDRATLPGGWKSERFTPVNAGKGEIALYCRAHRRFVQMRPDGSMRPKDKDLNADDLSPTWTYERFTVVQGHPYFYLEPGSVVAFRCFKHHRFMRMASGGMSRSEIHGAYKPNSTRSYTYFKVVDAGGGLIALHSAKYNRFVAMTSDGAVRASAKKSALELPDDWTSVRFAVVPAGNEQIALHNPWRGRFISMSTKDMVSSGSKKAKDLPGHWSWERFKEWHTAEWSKTSPSALDHNVSLFFDLLIYTASRRNSFMPSGFSFLQLGFAFAVGFTTAIGLGLTLALLFFFRERDRAPATAGAAAPLEACGASAASASGAQGYRSGPSGRLSATGPGPVTGVAESRAAIEASFTPIPPHLLDLARTLRSSVSTPVDRANRAWTAVLWAGAVLANRAVTPNCTPPLQLPSRLYVVLRTPDSDDVRVTASRAVYLRLVDHHRGLSLSHGWPTETEARIYTAGAGRASLPAGLLQEAANEGFVGLVGPYTTASAPAVELAENGDWLGVYPPRSIEFLLIDLADAASVALEPLEEGFAECTPFVEEAPMLFPLATAVATYALSWTAQVEGERGAGYVTAEELIPGTEPPLLERRPKAEPRRKPTVAALAVQQESIMEALAALSTQVQQLAKAGSPSEVRAPVVPVAGSLAPPNTAPRQVLAAPVSATVVPQHAPPKRLASLLGAPPKAVAPKSPDLPVLDEGAGALVPGDLDGEPIDEGGSLASALLAQSRALTSLVSQMAGSGDPLADLATGSSSSISVKGSAARMKLQRELHSRSGSFFLKVQEAALRRMEPTANLAMLEDDVRNRPILTRYLERYGGFQDQRTWGLIQWQLAQVFDLLGSGQVEGAKDVLAMTLVMIDQTVIDGGRPDLGWILSLQEDPPAQLFSAPQHTAGSIRPCSHLTDPKWLAVALSYVKEMETLSSKRTEMAKAPAGKASAAATPPGDSAPKAGPTLTRKQQRAKLWAERKAAANQGGT